MHLKSQKKSLIILALTALVSSRAFFALINDPEGPNLLVVTVMAAIIYALSVGMYLFIFSSKGHKRLILTILTQVLITFGAYFSLR